MRHLFLSCLMGMVASAGAQTVTFESVRLADIVVAGGWGAVEQSMPLVIAAFESQMKANGVSERAAKVFGEEVRLSLTRESVSKAFAMAISAKLTPDEVRETIAFLQSPSGQKYLSLSKDFATNPSVALPIAKQACSAAMQRLEGGADRQSLDSVCSRL